MFLKMSFAEMSAILSRPLCINHFDISLKYPETGNITDLGDVIEVYENIIMVSIC